MDTDIPMTEYMYCAKYGGFGFTDEFHEEYTRRFGTLQQSLRTDPNAIALFKERGQYGSCEMSDSWDDQPRLLCVIAIAKVPTVYVDFIRVHEYDGLESVRINHTAYIVDKLKRIDPQDSEAVAALVKEATSGPVHPGENMDGEEIEYYW